MQSDVHFQQSLSSDVPKFVEPRTRSRSPTLSGLKSPPGSLPSEAYGPLGSQISPRPWALDSAASVTSGLGSTYAESPPSEKRVLRQRTNARASCDDNSSAVADDHTDGDDVMEDSDLVSATSTLRVAKRQRKSPGVKRGRDVAIDEKQVGGSGTRRAAGAARTVTGTQAKTAKRAKTHEAADSSHAEDASSHRENEKLKRTLALFDKLQKPARKKGVEHELDSKDVSDD